MRINYANKSMQRWIFQCTGLIKRGVFVVMLIGCSGDPSETPATAESVDSTLAEPTPPAGLRHWVTGEDADAEVTPLGPGLILMGGGGEPDEAFQWWRNLLAAGDVVVLRASGSDGYNDYLFEDIGGVDSVETLLVDTVELANDPYVINRINRAEGVFLAGGDQWKYLSIWGGSGLQAALDKVMDRGGVLGGTSAGLAVLGERAFSAENNSVTSDEALSDPYNIYMQFVDQFLSVSDLKGHITDSHFAERDRMGRLVGFLARMWEEGFEQPRGIGVDEATAMLLGPSGRSVVGMGAVYELKPTRAPERCVPGEPLNWESISVTRHTAEGSISYSMSVVQGVLGASDGGPLYR